MGIQGSIFGVEAIAGGSAVFDGRCGQPASPALNDLSVAGDLIELMATSCLTHEQMARFLEGALTPDEEAQAALHLQVCGVCQHLARILSDDATTRDLLGCHSHASLRAADPLLVELKGRLHALALYEKSDSASWSEGKTVVVGDTKLSEPLPRERPNPGCRFGKFQIIRELGSGGFGVVYLAKDSILQRHVALKLPRGSLLTDLDARQRFYREAHALARLDHPHIVPVFDAGECEGTCYLATAFCDGPTLEEWCNQQPKPLEPATAARIVALLSTAVEHAHQHNILHRDIKPANILLSASQPGDELPFVPRLADFGLARISDEQPGQASVSGAVLGTPQYLAPEQAAGMKDRLGPATDVYGLGAVLYELLTGQPPIRGDGYADILRRVLVEKPAPPRCVSSAVPEALNRIVMKCLAKSTALRYATARELAQDLQSYLVQQASHPPSEGSFFSALRGAARFRWTAALAVGFLALVLGTGV